MEKQSSLAVGNDGQIYLFSGMSSGRVQIVGEVIEEETTGTEAVVQRSGETFTTDANYVTETENKRRWTTAELRELTDTYKQYHHDIMSSSIKHGEVWDNIFKNLEGSNIFISANKCKFKFNYLKRQYTATRDHNNKTGAAPKTCRFYDELDEIFGTDHFVEPIALASSIEGCFTILSVAEDSDITENSESNEEVRVLKRRRETTTEVLLKEMKNMRRDRKEKEEKRISLFSESINVQKRLIEAVERGNDIHKEMMEKLLERR